MVVRAVRGWRRDFGDRAAEIKANHFGLHTAALDAILHEGPRMGQLVAHDTLGIDRVHAYRVHTHYYFLSLSLLLLSSSS
jgi:hypothetical protein